jgi:MFS family permease
MFRHLKRFFSRYKNLSGNVFALSFVSLLNDTSSDIIYPLLPAFLALTLGASPFAIGLIEGFAESVAAFLKLFSGYLSDKFERRKLPVFLGYALPIELAKAFAVRRAMRLSPLVCRKKSAVWHSDLIAPPTTLAQ